MPAQAQVLARNTSDDTTYCIEVTITATDRDGLSLVVARSPRRRPVTARSRPVAAPTSTPCSTT